METIARWHERLLVEALEWRRTHPDFRFALRSIELHGRLERGYWFLGNDSGYLFFGPFAPGDRQNKTKTIGFAVDFENGEPIASKLDIVFRAPENPQHLPLYKELIKQLGPFEKDGDENRYQRLYSGKGMVEAFREFVSVDYPRILALISNANALDAFMIREDKFAAMLKRVQERRDELARVSPALLKDLSLIGTWRGVGESDYSRITKAIGERGGWVCWWSFPIRDDYRSDLRPPFYLYLNAGGDRIPYRMRVEAFETEHGNQGIKSPWPAMTDREYIGRTREQGGDERVFKTWLRVGAIERLNRPLSTDDFEPAKGLQRNALLNQSAFGYAYRSDLEVAVKASATGLPTNLILFGPPGTGKTHWMRQKMREYTDTASTSDRETWLLELVAKYGWRPVIAAALAKMGPSRVSALREHEWVQAKIRERGRGPGVQQTLWGYLQEHTPESVTTVHSRSRREPFIFSKRADSSWELLPGWKEEDLEAVELFGLLSAGPGRASGPVRRYRAVTFHPSFSYEDFVRGLRPVQVNDEGDTHFRLVDGVFKQICDEATANPSQRYALFIDEINRANIAKVFGELITLIEADKRATFDAAGNPTSGMAVQLPGGGADERVEPLFGVPPNLDMYGTMNTADRSIALLDVALRRRFQFQEVEPDCSILSAVEGVDLGQLLERINDRLEYFLDRERRIGHGYFMSTRTLSDLRRVFRMNVIPLLQEYFFDDLARVGQVLSTNGPEFVRRDLLAGETLFREPPATSGSERYRYRVTDEQTWSLESFVGIYESGADGNEAL